MFSLKSSRKSGAVQRKSGKAADLIGYKQKKSSTSNIAVYGTSTIVGKVKAN